MNESTFCSKRAVASSSSSPFNFARARTSFFSRSRVVEALAKRRILGGVPVARFYPTYPELANVALLAVTETNTMADIDALVAGLKEVLS